MGMYKLLLSIWIYMILCLSAYYGLQCTCGDIQEGQDVECQCDTANGIEWYKGDTRITRCKGEICIPSLPPGYTLSHIGSAYKITIPTFSFTNCKGYKAKDMTTSQIVSFPYCSVLDMTKPANGGQFNILENTTMEFICKMRSGYPAGTVEWYVDSGTPNDFDDDVNISLDITSYSEQSPTDNQEYITTSTLTFTPSRVYSGNNIYCKATNKPEQTPLISHRKPRLTILYGPFVLPMSNQSVEEGKQFVYNCPNTPGNPADTTVKWTRNEDDKEWNSELLAFVNVSKEDRMRYTCTVQNIMEPTNQPPVTDPKAGAFYLDVKYKAAIEQFTVEDHIGNEVTVEEFTSPILVCNVDSNPSSNIKVLFQNQTLAEYPSTLKLKHQLFNVSCGSIGVYTCTVRNYLNTQESSSQDVVLLVKCQPRPYGEIAYKVYSSQGNPATLRLYSQAYPTISSVVWTKDGIVLQNTTKLTMTINHEKSSESHIDIIQIELLIHKLNVSDYGQYKLQIRNDVGTMKKTFVLIAEEIPDPAEQNIGMIVGGVVGGIVVAGLLTVAVVFLIRRHRTTSGGKNDNHHSNDCDQTDASKSTDDANNCNTESASHYEMVNKQNQNVMTYSSLQTDSNDPTKDCSTGEERTYEICE